MVSSSSTMHDPVQSLADSLVLETPDIHEAAMLTSVPFVPIGKPTVKTSIHVESRDLYPEEPNGGTSCKLQACVALVRYLWKVAKIVGQAGVRDPVDQSSADSGECGGVTGGYPNQITEAKAEFKRKLAVVPCLSSSARMEMLGAVVGVDFGCGGGYEGMVREEIEGMLATIDSYVGEEADGAVETEEPVLVNVFNSLDGEGKGYIETVECSDGGDQAFSHCGTQFRDE